jgi:ABC-type branched-subunit amino acid transport system ATPase component
MDALLEVSGLSAGYGPVNVIRGIDLEVRPGEVLALLGANGAGKTTTLMTLAGVLRPTSGEVRWLGSSAKSPLHRRARQGMAFVTEHRAVFAGLTTRQNLAVGRKCDISQAVALFPELDPLMSRRGGLLSGGEQQMLVVARALARPTKLFMADELSLGLAPQVVGRLLRAVRQAADGGVGVILVEQHVHRALEIADRVCVLRNGRMVFSGAAAELRGRAHELSEMYLGQEQRAEM